jgi:hypothetical protein
MLTGGGKGKELEIREKVEGKSEGSWMSRPSMRNILITRLHFLIFAACGFT